MTYDDEVRQVMRFGMAARTRLGPSEYRADAEAAADSIPDNTAKINGRFVRVEPISWAGQDPPHGKEYRVVEDPE